MTSRDVSMGWEPASQPASWAMSPPHQSHTHPKLFNILGFEVALTFYTPIATVQTRIAVRSGRERPGLGLDLAPDTHTHTPKFWVCWLLLTTGDLR